jgi:phage tail protein X
MSKGRERKKIPPKLCWVTYGLQRLSTEKFLDVVQKILDGELILLKTQDVSLPDPEVIPDTHVTENGRNLKGLKISRNIF